MSDARRPKVAFFVPSMSVGGTQLATLRLAGAFAERGYPTDLVLARAKGPFLERVPANVRIVDLQASRTLTSVPAMTRYLRRTQPDVVFSARNEANVVACVARRLAGASTRVVINVGSTLSRKAVDAPTFRGRSTMRWAGPFYRNSADAVVAISQGVAEDLVAHMGLPRDGVRIIYNPIITPELFDDAKERVDHPWFSPGQPPVVLGVGRLSVPKDFPTLLRAFALVRKERDAHLLVLGEGEERARLEALVDDLGLGDDVALPGFEGNPAKYMQRAAVCVVSSIWEGLPAVLVEALALGTPVVSTDCPSGPAEVLDGGRLGALVPTGDPEALAAGIMQTLEPQVPSDGHPPLTSSLERFTLEKAVEEYEQVAGLV
ncbi:MAG TPA: glycosyltransferase [Egibacteraceae bacterium]|nr:glycosyltransferase [Egibacteraceae bacterium]